MTGPAPARIRRRFVTELQLRHATGRGTFRVRLPIAPATVLALRSEYLCRAEADPVRYPHPALRRRRDTRYVGTALRWLRERRYDTQFGAHSARDRIRLAVACVRDLVALRTLPAVRSTPHAASRA